MNTNFYTKNSNEEANNPFATPDNYFEELSDKIYSKCKNEKLDFKKSKIKHYQLLAYAASILFIIATSVFILFNNSNTNQRNNKDISSAFFEEMLFIADINDIDETTLTNYISENSLIEEQSYTENDIIEYINNNTENYNEIIELFEY